MSRSLIILGCSSTAVICAAAQFFVKRLVNQRQYYYFKDLLLAGVTVLMALWFGDPASSNARAVTGAAFLACVTGLAESFYYEHKAAWAAAYLVIAILCALFGPAIHFIRLNSGEYIYLTPLMSFIATTLWFFIFPFVFRYIDNIPGLCGHILAVTFALMLAACLISNDGIDGGDAFFMAYSCLALLTAFWSRFGNAYRQAGRAMSSMWSILAAGTAIIGAAKGIVLSSMLFLSLGLFAMPICELSLYWVSQVFIDNGQYSLNNLYLYEKLINNGIEHPDAIRFVAGVCALISIAAALMQSSDLYAVWTFWSIAAICALAAVLPVLFRLIKLKMNAKNSVIINDKPVLWGVPFDNVSMNYALTKARGLIFNADNKYKSAQLVATVNALGLDESLRDAEYRDILKNAALVLADGTGLLMGMRFLGMPIQERITGIDFAENLCRMAAAEGWPVYFLGAKGDTAKICAEALAAKYPGLIVAGARDGYFDVKDVSIADRVASSGAKILLVAMGLPRQEKWVNLHAERLGPVLAIGVGGSFDVYAGNLKRAPLWMQHIGFEWLYRLIQEPFRWRKDLRLFIFVIKILFAKIFKSLRDEPK
ncbi:MAG: WecB/TagA/CpsF family glycosyltransferase [Synergistaceae bacterium]|nr:WecB/TagA/CpsF family glycosyltransferase [Synergistaceae bacterium]